MRCFALICVAGFLLTPTIAAQAQQREYPRYAIPDARPSYRAVDLGPAEAILPAAEYGALRESFPRMKWDMAGLADFDMDGVAELIVILPIDPYRCGTIGCSPAIFARH